MKLEKILRKAAFTALAAGTLACTGCASYQKGVDYAFYPLHQLARQADGEAEGNLYDQAASVVSDDKEIQQAAKEVPGVVTTGDLLLEPIKIYGAVKAASGKGGGSDKSIPPHNKGHTGGGNGN